MTFLTETPTWEGGIYQLETTDPVQGGAAGVSNSQAKALANRTNYLKQAVDALSGVVTGVAPLDSPLFTGDPRGPTAVASDDDTSLATTAFVQRAVRGVTTIASNGGATNLSLAQAALPAIVITGALTSNANITVPAAASRLWRVTNATTGNFSLTFRTATGVGIVVPQGTSVLAFGDGTNVVDGLTAINAIVANGALSINDSIVLANSKPLSGKLSTGTVAQLLALNTSNVLQIGSVGAAHGSTEFVNNGAVLAALTAAGRFGLGVASPSHVLHARVAAAAAEVRTASGTAGDAIVSVEAEGVRVGAMALRRASGMLAFALDGTDRMTLSATGTLALGTPTHTEALSVAGSAFLTRTGGALLRLADQLGEVRVLSAPDTPNGVTHMDLYTGGAVRARLTAAGRLGLGVTAPTQALDVAGSALLRGAGSLLLNNASNNSVIELLNAGASGASVLTIGLAGAEVARFASGHFGVGVEPVYRLDASASNPTRGIVQRLYNPAGSGHTGVQSVLHQAGIGTWAYGMPGGTNAFMVWRGRNVSADGTQALYLDGSGRLAIGDQGGPATTALLHLNHGTVRGAALVQNNVAAQSAMLRMTSVGGDADWSMTVGGSADTLQFIQGTTTRARFTETGQFVIGRTTLSAGADLELYRAAPILALNASSSGNTLLRGLDNDVQRWQIGQTTGGAAGFNVWVADSTLALNVDAGARLGVGAAANTAYRLYVAGKAAVTDTLRVEGAYLETSTAGTAAAPSIRPGADANTGLYLAAADTLGLTTAGTVTQVWFASSNTTIGAATERERLTISGGRLQAYNSNAAGGAYLEGYGAAALSLSAGAVVNGSESTFQAKTTSASGVQFTGAGAVFWGNTGLAAGSDFTRNVLATLSSSGFLGLGVTPTVKLHVQDDVFQVAVLKGTHSSGMNLGFHNAAGPVGSIGTNVATLNGPMVYESMGGDHVFRLGGTEYLKVGTRLVVSRAGYTAPKAVPFAASFGVDARESNVFIVGDLTAATTLTSISNPIEGQFITIRFTQDAGGGNAVTIPAAWRVSGSVGGAGGQVSYLNVAYNGAKSRFEGAWTIIPV